MGVATLTLISRKVVKYRNYLLKIEVKIVHIQSRVRSYLKYRKYQLLRHAVKLLKCVYRRVVRHRRYNACAKIQESYRKYRKLKALIKIRAWLMRAASRITATKEARCTDACTAIQSLYRRKQAVRYREVYVLSVVRVQRLWKAYVKRCVDKRSAYACTAMQSLYRRKQAMRYREVYVLSVVRVQRVFRRYMHRLLVTDISCRDDSHSIDLNTVLFVDESFIGLDITSFDVCDDLEAVANTSIPLVVGASNGEEEEEKESNISMTILRGTVSNVEDEDADASVTLVRGSSLALDKDDERVDAASMTLVNSAVGNGDEMDDRENEAPLTIVLGVARYVEDESEDIVSTTVVRDDIGTVKCAVEGDDASITMIGETTINGFEEDDIFDDAAMTINGSEEDEEDVGDASIPLGHESAIEVGDTQDYIVAIAAGPISKSIKVADTLMNMLYPLLTVFHSDPSAGNGDADEVMGDDGEEQNDASMTMIRDTASNYDEEDEIDDASTTMLHEDGDENNIGASMTMVHDSVSIENGCSEKDDVRVNIEDDVEEEENQADMSVNMIDVSVNTEDAFGEEEGKQVNVSVNMIDVSVNTGYSDDSDNEATMESIIRDVSSDEDSDGDDSDDEVVSPLFPKLPIQKKLKDIVLLKSNLHF